MANRPTAFKPGQSGNPKGRPPKGRALTDILEKALAKRVEHGDEGKTVARKTLMAERVADAVATGFVDLPLPDGSTARMPLSVKDWRDLVKWVYTHVDGSKVLNEHSGPDGGDIPVRMVTDEERQRRLDELRGADGTR